MTELIRVLVTDDHPVVRQGLSMLLVPRNGMEMVGEASNGLEAVELVHTLQPDVVLIDMVMPGMDGPEAIARIKMQDPESRILVLTSFDESEQIATALQAGALGYLLKDSSPDELLHAIRCVYRNTLILPSQLAQSLVHRPPPAPAPNSLTDRETDVLKLLVEGQTNGEIAHALSIGYTTVRSHVSSILAKLSVSNRTQAALVARERQLV